MLHTRPHYRPNQEEVTLLMGRGETASFQPFLIVEDHNNQKVVMTILPLCMMGFLIFFEALSTCGSADWFVRVWHRSCLMRRYAMKSGASKQRRVRILPAYVLHQTFHILAFGIGPGGKTSAQGIAAVRLLFSKYRLAEIAPATRR